MQLSGESINLIAQYVSQQTVKINPVLSSLQRPKYIDQLVESYIADLVLYMFEVMGAERANQFKKKHLGFIDFTPTGKHLNMLSNENPLDE